MLVANAGITRDTLLLRMGEDAWDEVLDTNLTGVYRVVRRAVGPMVRAHRGRIVLVSSVVAFLGSPGQVNYGGGQGRASSAWPARWPARSGAGASPSTSSLPAWSRPI